MSRLSCFPRPTQAIPIKIKIHNVSPSSRPVGQYCQIRRGAKQASGMRFRRSRRMTVSQDRKRPAHEGHGLACSRGGAFSIWGGEGSRRRLARPRGSGFALWRLNAVSRLSKCFLVQLSSRMLMATDEQLHEPSAIEPFVAVVEHDYEGVQHALHTLRRRRALCKPADRVGRFGHEESKPAKWSCAAVKRWTTLMDLPQRGQCQSWHSGKGGGGSGSRPCAASSVRARGSSCLRKRFDSRP